MTADYTKAQAEDVRLLILQELGAQLDGRLSSRMLEKALYASGHNKSPEYLISQLAELEERGAVETTTHGDIVISTITKLGMMHVLRQRNIQGVREPRRGV